MSRRGEQLYYRKFIETKEYGESRDFPLYFMFDGTLSYELIAFFDFEFKNDRGMGGELTASTIAEIYYYLKNVDCIERYNQSPHLLVLDYAYSRLKDKDLWLERIPLRSVIRRIEALRLMEEALKAQFGYNIVLTSNTLFKRSIKAASISGVNKSLLSHINDGYSKKEFLSRQTGSINVAHRSNSTARLLKSFPPELIIDFINAEQDPNQKVGYLLQVGAAFRASETLHVLTSDIGFSKYRSKIIFPSPNGKTLSDDFRGTIQRNCLFEEYDSINPKLQIPLYAKQSQKDKIRFLNRLTERSALPRTHLMWSGFKGIDVTNASVDAGSHIEFIHEAIEKLTLKIIDEELIPQNRVRHHPYLLCDKYGYPLAKQTYERRFKRNVAKLYGLKLGPHSFRHFSGCFLANNLEVSIESARHLMRHVSIESTKVYYRLDSATLRNHISKEEFKSKYKALDFSELRR